MDKDNRKAFATLLSKGEEVNLPYVEPRFVYPDELPKYVIAPPPTAFMNSVDPTQVAMSGVLIPISPIDTELRRIADEGTIFDPKSIKNLTARENELLLSLEH